MLVACLWTLSRGYNREKEFYSFAAIADELPPEAAAGHDCCIVPIKRKNLDAWPNPNPHDLGALQTFLEDRDRPYYEHCLAA